MPQELDDIVLPAPDEHLPNVTLDGPKSAVSVSLKYWHSSSQCVSEWGRDELKKLRRFIEKIQSMSWAQIKADGGLGYCLHKGPPKGHGFSRPTSLSKDHTLIEMKVGGKSRVHGVENNDLFFLVWLDRNHAVFPDKK
jgi:hypothetical protein